MAALEEHLAQLNIRPARELKKYTVRRKPQAHVPLGELFGQLPWREGLRTQRPPVYWRCLCNLRLNADVEQCRECRTERANGKTTLDEWRVFVGQNRELLAKYLSYCNDMAVIQPLCQIYSLANLRSGGGDKELRIENLLDKTFGEQRPTSCLGSKCSEDNKCPACKDKAVRDRARERKRKSRKNHQSKAPVDLDENLARARAEYDALEKIAHSNDWKKVNWFINENTSELNSFNRTLQHSNVINTLALLYKEKRAPDNESALQDLRQAGQQMMEICNDESLAKNVVADIFSSIGGRFRERGHAVEGMTFLLTGGCMATGEVTKAWNLCQLAFSYIAMGRMDDAKSCLEIAVANQAQLCAVEIEEQQQEQRKRARANEVIHKPGLRETDWAITYMRLIVLQCEQGDPISLHGELSRVQNVFIRKGYAADDRRMAQLAWARAAIYRQHDAGLALQQYKIAADIAAEKNYPGFEGVEWEMLSLVLDCVEDERQLSAAALAEDRTPHWDPVRLLVAYRRGGADEQTLMPLFAQWTSTYNKTRQRCGKESPEVAVALLQLGRALQLIGRSNSASRLLYKAKELADAHVTQVQEFFRYSLGDWTWIIPKIEVLLSTLSQLEPQLDAPLPILDVLLPPEDPRPISISPRPISPQVDGQYFPYYENYDDAPCVGELENAHTFVLAPGAFGLDDPANMAPLMDLQAEAWASSFPLQPDLMDGSLNSFPFEG